MRHGQRLTLIDCQCLSGADRILDLSAVEIVSSEDVQVFVCEGGCRNLLQDANALNEDFENSLLGFLVETVISESNVDSRLESIIKSL